MVKRKGRLTVTIWKSCMKFGFDPANIHSSDSTNAASAQIRGTITVTRILATISIKALGVVGLVARLRGCFRSQIEIYNTQTTTTDESLIVIQKDHIEQS